MGICDGRVVIVTGSGRGIGREHALAYAAEGAKVVVNDLGGDMHGDGGSLSPAMEVVEEIKGMGGEAVADGENVADFAGAGRMVQRAIDTFGRLDTHRQQRRHPPRPHAHQHGRVGVGRGDRGAPQGRVRADPPRGRVLARAGEGRQRRCTGRIVNTSSPSGVFGNAGQTNYGAAKAGIAAFTIICGLELGRYGVLRQRDRAGGAHAHDRGPHGRRRARRRRGSTRSTPPTSRRSSCGSARTTTPT